MHYFGILTQMVESYFRLVFKNPTSKRVSMQKLWLYSLIIWQGEYRWDPSLTTYSSLQAPQCFSYSLEQPDSMLHWRLLQFELEIRLIYYSWTCVCTTKRALSTSVRVWKSFCKMSLARASNRWAILWKVGNSGGGMALKDKWDSILKHSKM